MRNPRCCNDQRCRHVGIALTCERGRRRARERPLAYIIAAWAATGWCCNQVAQSLTASHLAHTVAIVGVHDENDTLGVLVIVAPQRADLVLASDVPNGERDILVLDSLHVEANRWYGGDDLAELELVQDRCVCLSELLERYEVTHMRTYHVTCAAHGCGKMNSQGITKIIINQSDNREPWQCVRGSTYWSFRRHPTRP